MKKLVAILLLAFVLEHAPFRLAALVIETCYMPPSLVRMSHETDRYWDTLNLQLTLERMGWNVTYESNLMDGAAYGVTFFEPRAIQIETKLMWNDRLAVLAHEGGHTLQPRRLTSEQGEVFAEAVAALVAHDGLREHARYLAQHRASLLTAVVYWQEIYRAADMLR